MALHGGLIPYGGHLPRLLRLHAPADPPGGADAAARSSTSSPTTASAWARTARPTSRSSTSPRLRAIPNLIVIRPADANETAEAWRVALRARDGPTALVLTRQNLPVLDRAQRRPRRAGLARGAYVLGRGRERHARGHPDRHRLRGGAGAGGAASSWPRRASRRAWCRMPCWELFDAQPPSYRDAVLPPAVTARLAVEAGVPLGWERYVGADGDVHRHGPLRRLRAGRDRCSRSSASPWRTSSPGQACYAACGSREDKVMR